MESKEIHVHLSDSSLRIVPSVQSLSRVRLFATPWTAARQASLSITNSRSLLKLMSIESVMPSSHLILCCPLFLLPSIFPSIRVFFATPGRNIKIFRAKDEEETKNFLTPPTCKIFLLQRLLNSRKYSREYMFRQKFLVVMSLSAFFKGSEKVESLKWEYEWFETYLNCNNIYIWKTNQKNHFCNSN